MPKPDKTAGGPVSVSVDGKMEVTDPDLLDKVTGGSGEPGGEDPEDGYLNVHCSSPDQDAPTPA